MSYRIKTTSRFEKDYKRCKKCGYDLSKIKLAVEILAKEGSLPPSYKPHILRGNRQGQWECHIAPDWLMIWEKNDKEITIILTETGTHFDLFK